MEKDLENGAYTHFITLEARKRDEEMKDDIRV